MIKLFLTISIVVSAFFAVMFPAQVGLNDPLGLDAVRQQSFTESTLFSGNLESYYKDEGLGIFDSDGNLNKLDDKIQNAANLPSSGDQSVITDVGFGFLDYVRIVFNGILSILIFSIIPVILLFNMGAPFNIVFALPYTLLYIVSIFSYILGR